MSKYNRLSGSNILDYLKDTYGAVNLTHKKTIGGLNPLLQANYGGDMDCTLTSITTILNTGDPAETYNQVEAVAKKYFYHPKIGTNFFCIKPILNALTGEKTHSGFLKNLGYSWNDITTTIQEKRPIILSMWNDGKNYYKKHSVLIVGYAEYNDGAIKMLMVYDNWYRSVSYIDFNKLSWISSINYI